MLFWVKYLKGLLQSFHDDTSPNEIAGAFVLGAWIGLIPKTNLTTLIIWIITWVFRVNLGIALATIAVFSLLGHFTDPIVEKWGYFALTGIPALQGFWTALYNAPLLPYLSFNNTLVMGNLIFGLILAVPLFLGMRAFVGVYRTRYREKISKWKVMQALQTTKFYDAYERWIKRP